MLLFIREDSENDDFEVSAPEDAAQKPPPLKQAKDSGRNFKRSRSAATQLIFDDAML